MIKPFFLIFAFVFILSITINGACQYKEPAACKFIPNIDRGHYYKYHDYDFNALILEQVWNFIFENQEENEDRYNCLTSHQLKLLAWMNFDTQVTNGGLGQFFYNGYGDQYPLVIEGLNDVGSTEMASRIHNVVSKFKHSKWEINFPDFDSSISKLEDYFYANSLLIMGNYEKYIRNNSSHFALDEHGKELIKNFNGEIVTYYESDSLRSAFKLINGLIDGEYLEYHENGNLREKLIFDNGKFNDNAVYYYDNGNQKLLLRFNPELNCLKTIDFFANGKRKKEECKDLDTNKKRGLYAEYYDNGNPKLLSDYDKNSNRINRTDFHRNGSKSKTYRRGQSRWLIIDNSWLENGEQTLINGTGYVLDKGYTTYPDTSYYQKYNHYIKGRRNGKYVAFYDGILRESNEWVDHQMHGTSREYYKNGNIKREIIYQNGKRVSEKSYRKFKNPFVIAKISLKHSDLNYKYFPQYHIPDTPPEIINKSELERIFTVKPSLYGVYHKDDDIVTFQHRVHINAKGEIYKKEFLSIRHDLVDKELEKSYNLMKFKPAMKDGEPVKSISYIKHTLSLTE